MIENANVIFRVYLHKSSTRVINKVATDTGTVDIAPNEVQPIRKISLAC